MFAAIVYAVVLGLVLLIARGDTGLFALRPPRSWEGVRSEWAFVVFVLILLSAQRSIPSSTPERSRA